MGSDEELGAVIAEFLGDAEAGVVRRAGGAPYTREELRELRGALSHVSSELGTLDVGAVRSRDVGALIDRLRAAGLPQQRVSAILDALRSVYAYAIGRGLVATSPLVGLAPPATPEAEAPSPTTAMLTFGEHLVTFTVRLIVIAFVLAAVGLAVALA